MDYNKIKGLLAALLCLALNGCNEKKDDNVLSVGTSADYPPFEYYENGKMVGFDIDFAEELAKELGKKCSMVDMPFDSILASIDNGSIDVGMAGVEATEERKKNFDFSECYYHDSYGTIYKKDRPVTNLNQLSKLKVGVQLGCTQEIWLKKHIPNAEIVTMSNNNSLVEALKAGHIDCIFMGYSQCISFCEKNENLGCSILIESDDDGSAIVVKKNSKLTAKLDKAIKALKKKGIIDKLKKKWFKWKK